MSLILLIAFQSVQPILTIADLRSDPYLQYQPHFAFSLPVQILCNGIILTLAAVLLIHLTLTAQYHWPLARLNYVLQLSAVITLCISLIATTIVIFSSVHSDSRGWPYMLDYVAVDIPCDGWNLTEQILWYTLEALTSGLAHASVCPFPIVTRCSDGGFLYTDYPYTISDAHVSFKS